MATRAKLDGPLWLPDSGIDVGSRSNYACKNKSIVRGLAYHRRMYRALEAWHPLHAPEQQLLIEPWLRNTCSRRLLQPDAILVDPATATGIVIEVKMNWKDGRDEKLIAEYLPAAQSAYELECVWPALITSNVAGLTHAPRLGLGSLLGCASWFPGEPTPVVLVP